MNKSIRAIIVFCLAAFICACEKEPVHVERLILDKEALTVQVGETKMINVTVSPANAEDKKVIWTSSDSSIATVSVDGIVTGVAAGTASVKAISDDRGITAVCIVTVVPRAVTELSIEPAELTLKELEKSILNVTITPENVLNKSIEWTSSDPEVASVSYGVVYALKAGEATITAKSAEGDRTATCKVTVICPVKGVRLSDHAVTIKVGKSTTLDAEVYPSRAADKTVTWASDNSSVATVSSEGVVTGVASGTARITVRTIDGDFTDECTVAVVSDVEGISLNRTDAFELVVDETFDFVATIEPGGATNQTVNWSSTKPEVASIDQNGHVVALHAGETIICATTQDGGYHAYCTVKVRNKIDKIFVSPSKITLFVGGEGKTLTYTTSPADAGNVGIVWSSTKENIATVDQNGHVTPVGKGEAKIWASTTNGDVFDGCVVTVQQPVTSISVDPASKVIWTGESEVFTVTLLPDDADNLNYTATVTEGKDAVSISKAGNKVTVKASKVGSAKIQFMPELPLSSDMKPAECVIEIKAHVSSVSIVGGNHSVDVGKSVKLNANVLPDDATDKSVTWSIDKTDVATIDNNGNVTGIAPGTATVTVTTTDSGKTAKCTITVNQPVESVSLNKTTLSLKEGESETLTAQATPSDADQSFTWISSNTGVATVDSNGKVTAVAPGSAVITATATSNSSKKAECAVTVTPNTIPVDSVTVSPEELTLVVGETAQISATVLPSNATNRATKWSTNSSAVSVDHGLVTARQTGSALVMCTSEDNPKAMGTCKVTVVPPPVAVTSITLNKTSMTLSYGVSATLEATISPSDASDKTVQWSSSDTSVATVSENGRVMAQHKTGTATITAKSTNYPDVTATCTVTVKSSIVNVTGISINPRSLSLYVGQTKQIVATVSPSNADDKTVIWEAAGGATVMVDQQGNVKGLKPGNTTVTAFTSGKEYQTTARISVTINEIDHIELSHPNGIVLKVGETFDLTATPVAADSSADPSYPNISWSSGDKTVATVDNGHIVALKPGQVTITVVSVNNTRIKATCPVTVLPAGASGGGSEGVGFDDWDF